LKKALARLVNLSNFEVVFNSTHQFMDDHAKKIGHLLKSLPEIRSLGLFFNHTPISITAVEDMFVGL